MYGIVNKDFIKISCCLLLTPHIEPPLDGTFVGAKGHLSLLNKSQCPVCNGDSDRCYKSQCQDVCSKIVLR